MKLHRANHLVHRTQSDIVWVAHSTGEKSSPVGSPSCSGFCFRKCRKIIWMMDGEIRIKMAHVDLHVNLRIGSMCRGHG